MSLSGPILVIDDDEVLRTMIMEILADESYPVIGACDGLQGLEAVQSCRPELILLDMRMPRMNGWEFVKAYRELPGPSVPIVVCTAASNAASWAEEVQADGFLAKPFALEDLLATVHTFVSRAAEIAAEI